MDRFMDAWNRHDAKSFASVFAEDGDSTNWRGTAAGGRSKIEEFQASLVFPCANFHAAPGFSIFPFVSFHASLVFPCAVSSLLSDSRLGNRQISEIQSLFWAELFPVTSRKIPCSISAQKRQKA